MHGRLHTLQLPQVLVFLLHLSREFVSKLLLLVPWNLPDLQCYRRNQLLWPSHRTAAPFSRIRTRTVAPALPTLRTLHRASSLHASNHTQYIIRLQGIDAPEHHQAFGTKSKEHLSELVAGKTVEVDYSKYDRYGRVLGIVMVNGEDVNLEQVEAGMAWHYKKYQREQSTVDRIQYFHPHLIFFERSDPPDRPSQQHIAAAVIPQAGEPVEQNNLTSLAAALATDTTADGHGAY